MNRGYGNGNGGHGLMLYSPTCSPSSGGQVTPQVQ